MQNPHRRSGRVVEYGKQNAVSIFALTVEKLANLLAKEGVFPGDGTSAGHDFKASDRGNELLVPFLSSFRAGVLGKV